MLVKLGRQVSAVTLAMIMAIVGIVAAAQPAAAASTRNVTIKVGSQWCPGGWTAYVRGVSSAGTAGPADISWTGWSTAPSVPVTNVPSGGQQVLVTVAYSCRGRFVWQQSTPAPIQASRWIYGSGYQPSWWF